MDVTPQIPKGRQLIEAYGDGGFKISGVRHSHSVLLFPDRTEPWDVADFAQLADVDFTPILTNEPQPEMVLIGCGTEFMPVPAAVRKQFRAAGVPLEMMDTGAACRTYNILLAEGRRVAALLIAV